MNANFQFNGLWTMPDKKRVYKNINIRFFILYFSILLTLQAIGILFFIKYPTITSALIVGVSLGLFLPIALGYLLISIFKIRYKQEMG